MIFECCVLRFGTFHSYFCFRVRPNMIHTALDNTQELTKRSIRQIDWLPESPTLQKAEHELILANEKELREIVNKLKSDPYSVDLLISLFATSVHHYRRLVISISFQTNLVKRNN